MSKDLISASVPKKLVEPFQWPSPQMVFVNGDDPSSSAYPMSTS